MHRDVHVCIFLFRCEHTTPVKTHPLGTTSSSRAAAVVSDTGHRTPLANPYLERLEKFWPALDPGSILFLGREHEH